MAPASTLHSTDSKTVCVMDASCRPGATLVERLLQRGYTVHAAAYSHGDDHESNGLKKLAIENTERLKLFRSDPFDYQSIVDAMRGCSGLFYMFDATDLDHHHQTSYDEFMVEVEVRAAHNVLEACAQTETMDKVVFTSSATAVVWKENRKLATDFDERDWSEPNLCRKFKLWHALAKTLSEKTAWALAMDRGVAMVSVNAGLVIGPGLSAADPYLRGAPEMYENGVLVTVEADFLADAHVAVYEAPSAYGRYICFDRAVCRPEDVVKLTGMLSPSASDRPPRTDDELRVIEQRIQNKKLNKIMMEYAGGRHVDLD